MAELIPISNALELAHLRYKKFQDRRLADSVEKIKDSKTGEILRIPKLRTTYALDSETDKEGDMFLLADSEGNYIDNINIDTVLEFLFSKRYQGSWNFFWNLEFDARGILKLLGDRLTQYLNKGRLEFEYRGYTITYFQKKQLDIKKGHHSALFFDMCQYYDHAKLADTYANNIRKPFDPQYLQTKSATSEFTKREYRRNLKRIRHYCILDCQYTKELSEHFIQLIFIVAKFYPMKWHSVGYLAEKFMTKYNFPVPYFHEIPFDVQVIAWRAYSAGWFELLKRGYFEKTYQYDINNAYPSALRSIPNLRCGKWEQLRYLDKSALLGFFHIECDIPAETYIPPFAMRLTNHNPIRPTGKFQTFVALAELQAYNHPEHYSILDSWQYFDSSPQFPFKELIEEMYQKRLELKEKNDPRQLPLKLIPNSMWGKFSESGKRRLPYGNYFTPVMASSIPAITRAKMYQTIQKYNLESDIISVATDAILTKRKLDLNSKLLGEFSYKESTEDDNVVIIQNGIMLSNNMLIKSRGFMKEGGKKIELSEIEIPVGKQYMILKGKKPNTLIDSIRKGRIDKINKFEPYEKKINFNADHKRFWILDMKDINDKRMYESIPHNFPIMIDMLKPKLVPSSS